MILHSIDIFNIPFAPYFILMPAIPMIRFTKPFFQWNGACDQLLLSGDIELILLSLIHISEPTRH